VVLWKEKDTAREGRNKDEGAICKNQSYILENIIRASTVSCAKEDENGRGRRGKIK